MRATVSKLLFALTALAIVSCEEWNVEMDTEIMRDGSCVRTVKTDNSNCLAPDEGWQKQIIKDSVRTFSRDTIHTAIMSRNFDKVEDMNAFPALQLSGKPVSSEATLDKSFKWFYTDYTFTETFKGWQDAFDIPLTDYVSEDEASFWYTGYPELPEGITGQELDYLSDISFETDHWSYDVGWDIYFRSVAHYYDLIENAPVDRETFLSMRDSVMKAAWEDDMDFFDDGGALVFLDRFFHTGVYSEFLDCGEFNDYLTVLYQHGLGLNNLKVSYTLRMPGKVTDAGRGKIEDGVIRYRFGGAYLIPGDYTFTATSRCVNVWAFLLSGLILAAAVGSFFIKR